MDISRNTKRRTVLKTIGAGAVGATVMVGSVTAHTCEADLCIHLEDFEFAELPASISVPDGESKLVNFTNVEPKEFDAIAPKHDVNIHEHGATSQDEVNSDVLSGGSPGESYQVKLENPGNSDLKVIETNAFGNSGGPPETITASFSGGSVELHVHCRHHQGMEGDLTVNRN